MNNIFYVDAENGDDSHTGASPEEAWRTLHRATLQDLGPGDAILLKRGCTWEESVKIRGNGKDGAPITLGTYGAGPKPRIVGSKFPLLGNDGPVSWWHIKGLELKGSGTFDPYAREQGQEHGIYFHQASLSEGLRIEDCVIHDLNGTGILFSAAKLGETIHGGWIITGCEVYNAGTGIATDGPWPPEKDLARAYRCNTDFKIQDCLVHDIAVDGIVLHYCQDGIIERCKAWRTGMGRACRTPVGIWFFLASRCTIQYCESYDNHAAGGHADGGGFDLDGGCTDCTLQYNYSHDNDGAGFLVCSYDPVNAPCIRCTVRFNLSVNDGRMNDYASIQLWQTDDCLFHNNTCITRIASCLKFASDCRGHLFANNIFVVDSQQDIPVIQSPFALTGNRFEHNLYWRSRGRVDFKLADNSRVAFEQRSDYFQSRNEQCKDPRLSAYQGMEIHPTEQSPALGSGIRLDDLGEVDLYGRPAGKTGPVSIGASLQPTGKGGV